MKTRNQNVLVTLALSLILNFHSSALAQGTAFTYQGRLNNGGAPANGSYDLTFSLFDAGTNGNLIAGPLTNSVIAVSNGLFTVTLDFGNEFPGAARWLEIGVRASGSGTFTILVPRQQFTSTPYAVQALGAGTAGLANSVAPGAVGSAQLAPGAAVANLAASGQAGVASGGVILSSNANSTNLLNAGYVKIGQTQLGEQWAAQALTSAPDPRESQSAAWTGSELIVWGGYGVSSYLNTGGRYNPALNTWTPTPTGGAPAPRGGHSAVWNGSTMIVWGGTSGTVTYADGGIFNPANNQWTPIPVSPLMPPRSYHTAVWTGTEMIVWGGLDTNSAPLNTGGIFTSAWVTNTSLVNAPGARYVHQAVWTGTEMLVWGGALSGSSFYSTGGHYNPASNTWVTMAASPLAPRYAHTMVWTGTKALVWGGLGSGVFGNGAQYDPVLKTWSTMSTVNEPAPRFYHQAVWTGSQMIISGGAVAFGTAVTNIGGRYDPVADSWTTISTTNAPVPRYLHSTVWDGSEMLLWGGYTGSVPLNDGKRYNPASDTWISTSGNAPAPRSFPTAVWTGSEMLVWGGRGSTYYGDGGLFNPALNNWTAINTAGGPGPRVAFSAVWTGTQLVVWGGFDSSEDVNVGARYNLLSDSWVPTTTVGAPTARSSAVTVWTGTNMIVWGGESGGNYVNSGGRYNPVSDSWAATSTTGAPVGREFHTAVWTGNEMLVWGGVTHGVTNNPDLNDGGRYNPVTDSWVAISTNGAPSARDSQSAVWTGTEMIVWGGETSFGAGFLNDGGRYNPTGDSWAPVTSAGAPAPRISHTAVWTGAEMIVWGGASSVNFNDGGRYDPVFNSWTPTTTSGAPPARSGHSAVWTGAEMLVFGGSVGISSYFDDTWAYTPGSTMYLYLKP